MIFNMMNYGGAGNVDDAYAIVKVTYPSGSTCYCKKADNSIEFEAEGTGGTAIFALPESGQWTCYCIDGTKSDSETFSPVQYELKTIALSYVNPTPIPTTATIRVTANAQGAINAQEANGDWTGGDPVVGTAATYTVPRTGRYLIVYVAGGGARYSYAQINNLGDTVNVPAQYGSTNVLTAPTYYPDGSSDGGDQPSSNYATVILSNTRGLSGYYGLDDGTGRDLIPGSTATFNNVLPGTYGCSFVGATITLVGTVTVVAGETTRYALS